MGLGVVCLKSLFNPCVKEKSTDFPCVKKVGKAGKEADRGIPHRENCEQVQHVVTKQVWVLHVGNNHARVTVSVESR